MRLHKPIGILLLLWPTLWALIIASRGHPQPHIFIVFILGVVLMRSAGCVINDFADREFDGHVQRTRSRPIVRGKVSPKEALTLFLILSGIAFALALTLNVFTILLAIPGLILAASYPFMKRITNLPQLVLGIAFSWGIPMAFTAEQGFVPLIGWLLMLANIIWTIAYDTEYAMVDREDDIKIGIKSTAILFGNYDRLIVAILQLITIFLLLTVGLLESMNNWYYMSVVAALLLCIYQLYLIRNGDPKNCFKAFLNNNWFGCAITLGLVCQFL
jgi:4-hydroxybenzoate polyprenyltransferase